MGSIVSFKPLALWYVGHATTARLRAMVFVLRASQRRGARRISLSRTRGARLLHSLGCLQGVHIENGRGGCERDDRVLYPHIRREECGEAGGRDDIDGVERHM